MDSSAIPVFQAGPYPVLHTSRVWEDEEEIELDVGLIIDGLPTILASTRFALDETWDRIQGALASGDARLGVAGMPYREDTVTGPRQFPSAYSQSRDAWPSPCTVSGSCSRTFVDWMQSSRPKPTRAMLFTRSRPGFHRTSLARRSTTDTQRLQLAAHVRH